MAKPPEVRSNPTWDPVPVPMPQPVGEFRQLYGKKAKGGATGLLWLASGVVIGIVDFDELRRHFAHLFACQA
jgi:hypothetical protein